MWINDQIKEVREAVENLDCDEQVSEVLTKIVDILEMLNKKKKNKDIVLR